MLDIGQVLSPQLFRGQEDPSRKGDSATSHSPMLPTLSSEESVSATSASHQFTISHLL